MSEHWELSKRFNLDTRPIEQRAFYDGRAKGLRGKPRKCPPRFVGYETDWLDGYDNGADEGRAFVGGAR